ncbi:MAG TPA: hypothetical protein VFU41_12095 [Gemmatimonadales bacterium]|nr:hypothetical protein [Gemmatimonadales bacterium]
MTGARSLALAALAAAALTACSGAGRGSGTGAKVTLRYRPPAGATYHYALEQQNSVKMETGPMAQLPGQEVTVHIYYTQAVTGPTAGGIGVTLTYDSTSMTPAGSAPALDQMHGVTSNVVYDERMRVVSARFTGVGGEPSQLTDQLERSVKGATFPLPESAVGVGDSWTTETEMAVGGALGATAPLKSRTTRRVKEIQVAGADTSIVLSVETTFPGDPVPINQRGQTATLQLSGTIAGEELFSLVKSALVRSSTGGTMRISVKGKGGMTMTMEQQTSLQMMGAQ